MIRVLLKLNPMLLKRRSKPHKPKKQRQPRKLSLLLQMLVIALQLRKIMHQMLHKRRQLLNKLIAKRNRKTLLAVAAVMMRQLPTHSPEKILNKSET